MVAEFKSHVLSRDEKGFMGIPFKRLLLAGVGGGLIYTFAKVAASGWSISLAIAAAIAFILLTAPQGGIPRCKGSARALLLIAEKDLQMKTIGGNFESCSKNRSWNAKACRFVSQGKRIKLIFVAITSFFPSRFSCPVLNC